MHQSNIFRSPKNKRIRYTRQIFMVERFQYSFTTCHHAVVSVHVRMEVSCISICGKGSFLNIIGRSQRSTLLSVSLKHLYRAMTVDLNFIHFIFEPRFPIILMQMYPTGIKQASVILATSNQRPETIRYRLVSF
jgi:hypothetical protein